MLRRTTRNKNAGQALSTSDPKSKLAAAVPPVAEITFRTQADSRSKAARRKTTSVYTNL